MAENTSIEWATHTFNPWEGCQKVGPGCDHCYAEARNARFGGGVAANWRPGAPRRRTSSANWRKPLQWQAEAKRTGIRPRVFCASLADVFDNAVHPDWRSDLFELIHQTPDLDWLLLTKRIGNVERMIWADGEMKSLPDNVWLGATIVNQEEADRDIPKLLAVPAKVRFLSMEPLLGPVNLTELNIREWLGDPEPAADEPDWRFNALDGSHWFEANGYICGGDGPVMAQLDWVIVGGESGTGARPVHPHWVRSLRDQCVAGGVPFLFKQWGEWGRAKPVPSGTAGKYAIATAGPLTGFWPAAVIKIDVYPRQFDLFGGSTVRERVGKKAAGRLLDGVQHDGMPT